MDTSSPSEAIDILGTSDNRIGLLLAEVCPTPLGWFYGILESVVSKVSAVMI